MARTGDLRIRVNRAEMRALKAAAKASNGRPVATWARDTLLAASKAALPVKATPGPQKTPLAPIRPNPAGPFGPGVDTLGRPLPRQPLVKTYDPDQS